MQNETLISKKPWYWRWWAFVCFVVAAILVIFGALFCYQLYQVYGEMKAGFHTGATAPYDMAKLVDHFAPQTGGAKPVVTIVEFGDFNCSQSRKAMPAVRQMLNKYGDKVKLYWRHYPVIAASSMDFALAGVCANEQGKFWLFHDFVLAGGAASIEALNKELPTLSIDMNKYNQCLKNKLTSAQVKKDYYAADDAAVVGTPTFFINGYKVSGALPLNVWEKVIDKFLLEYEKKSGN